MLWLKLISIPVNFLSGYHLSTKQFSDRKTKLAFFETLYLYAAGECNYRVRAKVLKAGWEDFATFSPEDLLRDLVDQAVLLLWNAFRNTKFCFTFFLFCFQGGQFFFAIFCTIDILASTSNIGWIPRTLNLKQNASYPRSPRKIKGKLFTISFSLNILPDSKHFLYLFL